MTGLSYIFNLRTERVPISEDLKARPNLAK